MVFAAALGVFVWPDPLLYRDVQLLGLQRAGHRSGMRTPHPRTALAASESVSGQPGQAPCLGLAAGCPDTVDGRAGRALQIVGVLR